MKKKMTAFKQKNKTKNKKIFYYEYKGRNIK